MNLAADFADASGSAEIEGLDPRNLRPLPPVRSSSLDEVARAVRTAREAQPKWQELSSADRFRLLERAAKRLLAERDEGLSIVRREIGKTPADALFTEALGPLDALRGWRKVIDHAPAGSVSLSPIAFPKKSARIELTPRGVVGIIAPWNFPVAGLYRSVFPALLLGNAIVVKPSEHSPRSSGWFLRILSEVLPPGTVNVLFGDGAIGEALVMADIDACVFTGSTAVGQLVERRCFDRGIACSAEMGGNDAAIVLNDADLPRTAAGLVQWALQNAGQACGAVEVVYADSRIAEQLVARLTDACRRLKRPVPDEGAGSYAPIAFRAQLERVQAQLTDARERGAVVETGGVADGLWLAPTVLSGCTTDMDIVREETFGPVIPVVSVDGAAEGIRHVNAGKYGLTASIWTRDLARADVLAGRLDVGVVTVNNHAFTGAIPELPWSGRRASGRGIAGSAWSLATFARPKAIVLDGSDSPEPFWVPYDGDLEELGHLLADAQLGRLTRAYKIPLLLRKRVKAVKAFFGIG
jgi:acyl-CoA reductase-like NAD-dependent aldehyde dehydrogenase